MVEMDVYVLALILRVTEILHHRIGNAIGVWVVSICDVLDAFKEDIYGDILDLDHLYFDSYSSKAIVAFKKWCKLMGTSYYGALREDFNMMEGVQKAKDEGNKFVIVEDLS